MRVAALALLAACSSSHPTTPDAARDASTVDADLGPCGFGPVIQPPNCVTGGLAAHPFPPGDYPVTVTGFSSGNYTYTQHFDAPIGSCAAVTSTGSPPTPVSGTWYLDATSAQWRTGSPDTRWYWCIDQTTGQPYVRGALYARDPESGTYGMVDWWTGAFTP